MRSLSVYPEPTPTGPQPSEDWHAVYEISSSHPLPTVDVTRSVRSVWLRGKFEQAYVRVMNRYKFTLISGYALGLAACWIVLFGPARIGRFVAVVATILISNMSFAYTLALRYDVARLLVGTYEFWFFSVSNLFSAVLLAIHLGDLRALLAFAIWFMLQNNILTDANTVFNRGYISAAIGVLLFLTSLAMALILGLIEDVHEFELLRLDANRRLRVQDALVHAYSTQAVMLARNIYRRWVTTSGPQTTPKRVATMHCVTLRARLELRRIEGDDQSAFSPQLIQVRSPPDNPEGDRSCIAQLEVIPVIERFPVHQIAVPSVRRVVFTKSHFKRKSVRGLLAILAYVGLILCFAAALLPQAPYSNEISTAAFTSSVVFVACLLSATQRELLRRLLCTFDFAFLSIQLLVVHACLCDMIGWGYTSLPVITIWLWIQWVLTSDAITPAVKLKWGIRRRLPASIMLVFIVAQVLVFVAVILEDTIELRNRVLVSISIHGRRLEMRVIPTLLSRLVLLFLWSWKVLWRMWTMEPDELIMIQGSLTYANTRRERKPRGATNPSKSSLSRWHRSAVRSIRAPTRASV